MTRLCDDAVVRTTVDLSDEAYHLAKSIARDTGQSLGLVISELIVRKNDSDQHGTGFYVQENGLPGFRSGRPRTQTDVKYAADEEWLYKSWDAEAKL